MKRAHALTATALVSSALTFMIVALVFDLRGSPVSAQPTDSPARATSPPADARADPLQVSKPPANASRPVYPQARPSTPSTANRPASNPPSSASLADFSADDLAKALVSRLQRGANDDRCDAYVAIKQLFHGVMKIALATKPTYDRADARDLAVRILGAIGAIKALPLFLRDIEFNPPDAMLSGDLSAINGYPSVEALAEMGPRVLPFVLDYLSETPRAKINDTEIELFGTILLGVYEHDLATVRVLVDERLRDEPPESNLYRLYDWLVTDAQRSG